MHLCGMDYKYFSPYCCERSSFGCTVAIICGNACRGPHRDSLYSGSEHSQFNSPRLVKREAGFPNPWRPLIGSNQLWCLNDSPYYREYPIWSIWYHLGWCHVTAILQASLINWNPYWLIVLTSSSDSNYVPKEHEDVDQYDPYAIPSEIMPCQSYPEIKMKSLLTYRVNELTWHSLCPYRAWRFWPIWLIYNTIQDKDILKPPYKFGESKWNPYWVIVLTSSSGTNNVPNEHEDVDQSDPYAIPFEIMPC